MGLFAAIRPLKAACFEVVPMAGSGWLRRATVEGPRKPGDSLKAFVRLFSVIAFAMGTTACAGSDSPSATVTVANATANDTGTPSVTAPATPEPAVPEYQILSKAELNQVLLTLDDMPNGYADTTTEADLVDDGGTFCRYKRPFPNKTYVTATFTKGSGFSAELIAPTIRQYANAAQAKSSMHKLVTVLKTCKKFTSEGQKLTVAKVKADPVGELSVAVRLEGDGFTLLQGYALVGPSMISVGTGGAISVDSDVVPALLKEQVDRYTEAALK